MDECPTERKPNFAFVDADNFRRQFEGYFQRKGISSHHFDILEIFDFERHDRWYFYSATNFDTDLPQWLSRLQEKERCVLKFGDLIETKKRRTQKGVDVKLAVDATRLAYSGTMRSFALYGGDLDFKPLIEAVSDAGVFSTVCSFDDPAKVPAANLLRSISDRYEHWGTRQVERSLEGKVVKVPMTSLDFVNHSKPSAYQSFTFNSKLFRYLERNDQYFLVFKRTGTRNYRLFGGLGPMKAWVALHGDHIEPH